MLALCKATPPPSCVTSAELHCTFQRALVAQVAGRCSQQQNSSADVSLQGQLGLGEAVFCMHRTWVPDLSPEQRNVWWTVLFLGRNVWDWQVSADNLTQRALKRDTQHWIEISPGLLPCQTQEKMLLFYRLNPTFPWLNLGVEQPWGASLLFPHPFVWRCGCRAGNIEGFICLTFWASGCEMLSINLTAEPTNSLLAETSLPLCLGRAGSG